MPPANTGAGLRAAPKRATLGTRLPDGMHAGRPPLAVSVFFCQPAASILRAPAQAGYGDKWPS